MAKVQWRGGALLGPVPPVMVTVKDPSDTEAGANIITVAWTGIVNTVPPKTYLSVRPERYSYALLKESREFVINLTTKDLIRAADFCGMYTGRKVKKFEKCGLHTEKASAVDVPLIAESPLCLECRVTDILPLGSHDMFLADIVAVDVEEVLLDKSGKLCLDRAGLAAFAHGTYYALGDIIGTFGFSVRKPKKPTRKKAASPAKSPRGNKAVPPAKNPAKNTSQIKKKRKTT